MDVGRLLPETLLDQLMAHQALMEGDATIVMPTLWCRCKSRR